MEEDGYTAVYPVNIKIYFSGNSQILQQCYCKEFV